MKTATHVLLPLAFASLVGGCGGSVEAPRTLETSDTGVAADAATAEDTSTADTSMADPDDAPNDAVPDATFDTRDAVTDAPTGCGASATSKACVECCRQPTPPNYGGFERYQYDTCQACPSCSGYSPCGTNLTPAADAACVGCLQKKLAKDGLKTECSTNAECAEFAKCLIGCPVR